MKQFIKVMKTRKLCVCELQALLGLAQPAISKHLKFLEDAGLVESHKDKHWMNYRFANGDDSMYAITLLNNLRKWLIDDLEIKKPPTHGSSG